MIILMSFAPVIWGIVVFSVVILALSFLLIFAKNKLVPQGEIDIVINGNPENTIKVQPGSSLLSALSDSNIFLPSACGGGGTCAMCDCYIDAGGGDVLPTELNHLTRKEVAEHKRLACQVKVRESMEVRVPEEILALRSGNVK